MRDQAGADTMRPMNGRVMIVVAAVSLALGGACGDDEDEQEPAATAAAQADPAEIESQIEQQLSTPATKVSSVKCPDDVSKSSFNCSVSWANGANGKVEVTETAPNRYTYEPVPGSVKVPGATVEESLEKELAAEGAPDAQANCPDTIIVKLDTTVTCDLSGAGGAAGGTVTYTFSSDDGTVDPESVETSSG